MYHRIVRGGGVGIRSDVEEDLEWLFSLSIFVPEQFWIQPHYVYGDTTVCARIPVLLSLSTHLGLSDNLRVPIPNAPFYYRVADLRCCAVPEASRAKLQGFRRTLAALSGMT